jgi:hypothetical protein
VWGIVLSVLLMMPFTAPDSTAQTAPSEPDHKMSEMPADMTADMPMGMPMGNKDFSEFSHHFAGAFVLVMALGEMSLVFPVTAFAWARSLLPLGMLGTGIYLLIWSDIDAWPFVEGLYKPFLIGDWETIQHKLYAVLLLTTGVIELLRRRGRLEKPGWWVPLPLFSIVGGLLLFLHFHHVHTGMDVILLHHRIMGATAILAGCCKLVPDALGSSHGTAAFPGRPAWDLVWSILLLQVGLELMLYFE